MKPQVNPIHPALIDVLRSQTMLAFAALIGSRAKGTARAGSDWDIALQWQPHLDWFGLLGQTETLRGQIALALNVSPAAVDLIDLRRANLAMRANVAEEGLPLTGDDGLAWMHFLQRTWRELEQHYWEQQHAA